MLFDDKKLTTEAIDELMKCPVHTVKPFSLMLAPVYVFMKLNQKFVSVKAPLDFFTPDELERMQRYETFYLPKFVQSSMRFQTAARLVKKLLTSDGGELGITPYELSKEVFSAMSGLWCSEIKIEPFFMSIFADELCGPLNPESLIEAREKTVVRHDQGLLLSGAFVFIALHLGCFDYEVLRETRQRIYTAIIEETLDYSEVMWGRSKNETNVSTVTYSVMDNALGDPEELENLFSETLIVGGIPARELVVQLRDLSDEHRSLSIDVLNNHGQEWSRKLVARLNNVKERNAKKREKAPTIYGEEGFVA